jgi:hypothetical protein
MDKHLAKLTKKRENTQINKMRDEKGNIAMNTYEIQKSIKEFMKVIFK